MKIVITCIGPKNGTNLIYNDLEILFVSDSKFCKKQDGKLFANPDEMMPDRKTTWREYVNSSEYQNNENNLKAGDLYNREIFRRLNSVLNYEYYILSAGWGLIKASRRIPKYDISFSGNEKCKKRNEFQIFQDTNDLIGIEETELIKFYGGKPYRNLFYSLTNSLKNQKLILFTGLTVPTQGGFKFERRYPTRNTNWHEDILKEDLCCL